MKEKILTFIILLFILSFFILIGIGVYFTINNVNNLINTKSASKEIITQENIPQNNNDTQLNVLEQLNSANDARVEEELISFNQKYNIYIDNSYIGSISGKFVNITGDIFTFKDKNGYIISSEKQIKRWGIKLNRMAELRDKSNNPIRLYWWRCNTRFFLS